MFDPGDPVERVVAELEPYESRQVRSEGVFSVFCPVCQEPTDPHTRTGKCMFCDTLLVRPGTQILIYPSAKRVVSQFTSGPKLFWGDPLTEEYRNKILKSLKSGPKSRSQLISVTGLSVGRLLGLLRKMREHQDICLVGKKRGSRYYLPEEAPRRS